MRDASTFAPSRRPESEVGFRNVVADTLSERNLAVFAAIDKLRSLSPGWDGYQGIPPSDEAFAQAKSFVAMLPSDMGVPAVEPSGSGEINLVWRNAAAYLEIGFAGEQQFSFLATQRAPLSERDFGDVPFDTNRLPITLHAIMGLFVAGDMQMRVSEPERASIAWAS